MAQQSLDRIRHEESPESQYAAEGNVVVAKISGIAKFLTEEQIANIRFSISDMTESILAGAVESEQRISIYKKSMTTSRDARQMINLLTSRYRGQDGQVLPGVQVEAMEGGHTVSEVAGHIGRVARVYEGAVSAIVTGRFSLETQVPQPDVVAVSLQKDGAPHWVVFYGGDLGLEPDLPRDRGSFTIDIGTFRPEELAAT